jgi:hypothetical protein
MAAIAPIIAPTTRPELTPTICVGLAALDEVLLWTVLLTELVLVEVVEVLDEVEEVVFVAVVVLVLEVVLDAVLEVEVLELELDIAAFEGANTMVDPSVDTVIAEEKG